MDLEFSDEPRYEKMAVAVSTPEPVQLSGAGSEIWEHWSTVALGEWHRNGGR